MTGSLARARARVTHARAGLRSRVPGPGSRGGSSTRGYKTTTTTVRGKRRARGASNALVVVVISTQEKGTA